MRGKKGVPVIRTDPTGVKGGKKRGPGDAASALPVFLPTGVRGGKKEAPAIRTPAHRCEGGAKKRGVCRIQVFAACECGRSISVDVFSPNRRRRCSCSIQIVVLYKEPFFKGGLRTGAFPAYRARSL